MATSAAEPLSRAEIERALREAGGDPRILALELYVMRRAGDLAPFERERRRLALQPRVEVR